MFKMGKMLTSAAVHSVEILSQVIYVVGKRSTIKTLPSKL